MAATTVSIEELEQDARRVKKASESGPVFITESGRPASVLLTIAEYRKLSGKQEDIVEPVGNAEVPCAEFDRSGMTIEEYRKMTGHLPNLADMLAEPEGVVGIEPDSSHMTTEKDCKETGHLPNIVDLLANPEGYDIEFDPPRMGSEPYRPMDLFE